MPRPDADVIDRLAPVLADWRQAGETRSAAMLFDGDQATSLEAVSEGVVRVILPSSRRVSGIGVFGSANGSLSLSTVDASGHESPIAGMQDLDLRALPLRWNRFWSGPAPSAGELLLRWRPRGPGASLREIEIFGLRPVSRPTSAAPLADRVLAGTAAETIETWADPDEMSVSAADVGWRGEATFHFELPIEPKLVERAFLVYELAGLSHWSAPLRQVNGFSLLGGHKAEAAAGGLQVEEISPEWLFRGDNELRFHPTQDDDAAGYRIRRVRLVSVAGVAAPQRGSGAAVAGDLARLSDGDPDTGIRARQGQTFLTVPLAADAQPASLSLQARERLSGRLVATTARADGRSAPVQEIDVSGFEPGWHSFSLDRLAPGSAVRLTWVPGREGTGLISELRVVASPAPEGSGRRLVVTHPLHGECVDHQVYVRGFVTGAAGDSARPRLSFGGVAIDNGIAADGAFELVADEPSSVRGRAWAIDLRARLADGQELTGTVSVDACTDRPLATPPTRRRDEPPPLVEDEGAPFGKLVVAAKGDVLEIGDARLHIPAGALERDTRVTMRPLVDSQVAAFDDPMMDNVTPGRTGFRMGPHNLRFKKPVRVTIPYDRSRVRPGLEPGELGVFTFAEQAGRWQRLPTVGMPSRNALVAETTHFSDFIVATLPQPEHPQAAQHTPKTIADLDVGNPAEGMTLIKPPTANSSGSARLSFPIDVVPGRNGMQPKLSLEYDSSTGNGLLGVGWTLPISHIMIDSKFGAPTFDNELSQRFLLDGDELVPTNPDEGTVDSRTYRRRVERGFEKITRTDRWGEGWTVRDRDGVVHKYGVPRSGTNAGRISATSDDEKPVYWALSYATDLVGNRVTYTYTRSEGGPANNDSRWQELLPMSILYTSAVDPAGTEIVPARFRVLFTYETRTDQTSSTRLGREIRTRNRLKTISSQYNDVSTGAWITFRKYTLGYKIGEFGKSLLANIQVGNASTSFYRHDFDYQPLTRNAQNQVEWGPAQVWGRLPAGDSGALGKGTAGSFGLSGFAGLGPPLCYPHVGAGMGGGTGDDQASEAFTDINGDGLPDVVRTNGQLFLNRFAHADRKSGVFVQQNVPPFLQVPVSEGKSSSRTYSLGLHFVYEMGANLSETISRAAQLRGLVDVNGDGLPDRFNGSNYQCNNFPGSTCSGGDTTLPFGAAIGLAGNDTSGYPLIADPTVNGEGTSFATQMVARWTAPFAGTVNIEGGARRMSTISSGQPNQPATDPVSYSIYHRYRSNAADALPGGYKKDHIWVHQAPPTETATCFPTTYPSGGPNFYCTGVQAYRQVQAGDELYFVVSAPEGNQRNVVEWSPKLRYLNISCTNAASPKTCVSARRTAYDRPIYEYDLYPDLRVAGSLPIPWVSASADTKPSGTRPTATTVRITGQINKTATPDDVRFQIVRLRPNLPPAPPTATVVWPSNGQPLLMTAAHTGTFNFDNPVVDIDVRGIWRQQGNNWTLDGDQLYFQVIADSPIDPASVAWKPVVTYQRYCYPDAADQQRQYIASGASRTMPSPQLLPIVCATNPAQVTQVIGSAASQQVEVQYPAFRYFPDRVPLGSPATTANPDGVTYPFNDNANHMIHLVSSIFITPGPRGVDSTSTDRGQVVALVQSKNRLLAKKVIPITGSAQQNVVFDANNLPMNGADPLYFTIVSYGMHTVSWNPGYYADAENGIPRDAHATIHHLAEPPLPGTVGPATHRGPLSTPISGGFHNWTFGIFNGNAVNGSGIPIPFDPDSIKLEYTSETDPTSPFFPATPASRGLPGNPPGGDVNLFGANLPLWRGRASDDYIAPGYFHASYSGAGAVQASLPPATAFRRSRSDTLGGGFNAIGSAEISSGNTASELDLLDLNGDSRPDLLGVDRVAVNLAATSDPGFGPQIASPIPFQGLLRRSNSWTSRWGVGIGSVASQLVAKPGADGSIQTLASTLPSFGLGYNIAATDIDVIDINGDGILDQVFKRPQTGNVDVRLGMGLSRGRAFQASTQTWPMPALPQSALDFVAQATPDVFGDFAPSDSDALRVQDSSSNSLQINIMGIGGGVAHSITRTVTDMVDINGDGLLDRVMKRPTSPGEMHVQINTGLGFLAPEVWATPPWQVPGENVRINSDSFSTVGLGTNDALGFSQTKSTAISGGVVLPIILIFVCLVLEVSAQGDNGDNNTQMTFQDVNGDSYPDLVFKRNDISMIGGGSDATVYAKLNPTGTANLLTHVEGPIGGSFDIEYARAGNEVDPDPLRHVDMPMNRWVMSKVTVNNQPENAGGTHNTWNQDVHVQNEFMYADGFYSRADREFVGFAKVTTRNTADASTIEDTYDTSDVARKGLLAKRVVRDSAGKVFDVAETQYETRVLQAAVPAVDPREVRWVVDRFRRYRSYDKGSTDPDATPTVMREEMRDYDNVWGQLTVFEDRGDVSTSADNVSYSVGYYQDVAKHLSKPNRVVASDPAGAVLAMRTATYEPNGLLKTVTNVLRGGRNPANGATYNGTTDVAAADYQTVNPTWTYGHNGLGNLDRVVDPTGYSIIVLQWDPYLIYPVWMHDSLNYGWTKAYNVAFGTVAEEEDVNGVRVKRGFDLHQRLSSVSTRSRFDAPWVERLRVDYQSTISATNPANALVTYSNPEESKTLALADGWGRLFQTKKNAIVDGGNGDPAGGVIVSGRIQRDAHGRKKAQGLPVLRTANTVTSSLSFDPIDYRHATGFTYDALSRVTQVDRPEGKGTLRTAYNIVSLNNVLRRQKIDTDSNGETVESYMDARGRVVSVDQHNTINGVFKTLTTKYAYDRLDRLTKVTDAKNNPTDITWDTRGKMVTLTNRDTGTTRYDHDKAGNIGRRENANGKLVRYLRTFNRLDKVDYPDSTDVTLVYGLPGAALGRAGRVESVTDETGVSLFDYDEIGNVAKTVWTPAAQPGQPTPASYTTDYTWDPVHAVLRSVSVGGEKTTYGYELGGTVNSISGTKGKLNPIYASKILHNELGERTIIQLGNGAVTRYTYEDATRRLDTVNTDAAGAPIQRLNYAYDFVGNVMQVADTVPPPPSPAPPLPPLEPGGATVLPGPSSRTFTYDDLHQLKTSAGSYTGIGSRGGRAYSLTMTYDEIGNIKRKTQADDNAAQAGGQLLPVPGTTHDLSYTHGSSRPHAATGINNQINTFDNDGNQLTSSASSFGGERVMTWNEDDRLRTIRQAGVVTTMLYRQNGDRAIKRGSSETFYVNPFYSERTGVSKTRHIMLGDERIATIVTSSVRAPTKLLYYHTDHLQSSGVMTDSSGAVFQHNQYLPFGETWTENVQNNDASNRTPYLFNGKEQDDTKLYYVGARFYDPVTAQWKSPDPILASYAGGAPNGGLHNPANLSVYSYAYNSPATLRDPTGLSPDSPQRIDLPEMVVKPLTIPDVVIMGDANSPAYSEHLANKGFSPGPREDLFRVTTPDPQPKELPPATGEQLVLEILKPYLPAPKPDRVHIDPAGSQSVECRASSTDDYARGTQRLQDFKLRADRVKAYLEAWESVGTHFEEREKWRNLASPVFNELNIEGLSRPRPMRR